MAKLRGTGVVTSGDFKSVKWVGKTKSGSAVTIELENAINLGNIDWAFADKNDTVAQIVFTATYSNTDATATDTTEPWTVECAETTTGAGEILLGSGVFYVGDTAIALTRGGGQFVDTREFRQIEADGDRGPVMGRIVLDKATATLTMNVLTILTRLADLYPALATE